jgi:hypothetical protein
MTKKKTTKKTAKATVRRAPSIAELVSPTTTLEERTASDAVAEELAKEAPGAALIAMMDEFKKLTIKVDKLSTENESLRDALIMSPTEGGRRIVGGDVPIELPMQKDPIDYAAFAVFRSPSSGFKQKLLRSTKKRYENGETEIFPATFAEFERGVCVLTDPELIELMQAKELENQAMGRPMFVEVHDKEQKLAARRGELSDRAIKSETVTTDTSLVELVV